MLPVPTPHRPGCPLSYSGQGFWGKGRTSSTSHALNPVAFGGPFCFGSLFAPPTTNPFTNQLDDKQAKIQGAVEAFTTSQELGPTGATKTKLLLAQRTLNEMEAHAEVKPFAAGISS